MGGAHGGRQLHDNGRLAVRANLQKLRDPEGAAFDRAFVKVMIEH